MKPGLQSESPSLQPTQPQQLVQHHLRDIRYAMFAVQHVMQDNKSTEDSHMVCKRRLWSAWSKIMQEGDQGSVRILAPLGFNHVQSWSQAGPPGPFVPTWFTVCPCGLISSSRCPWLCWWWLGPSRLSALSSAAAFFSCLLLLPACPLITSLLSWDQHAHTQKQTHTHTCRYPLYLSKSYRVSWVCL